MDEIYKPRVFGTFVKHADTLYCTSMYIQWGNSSDSIGAVMTTNPGGVQVNQAEFWSTFLDDDSDQGCVEIPATPYIKAWLNLLQTEEGKGYLHQKYSTDGFRIYPTGRLYFYSLFHAFDQFQTRDQEAQWNCLEGIYALLSDVVGLENHPYVLWDLDQKLPFRSGSVSDIDHLLSSTEEQALELVESLVEFWTSVFELHRVPTCSHNRFDIDHRNSLPEQFFIAVHDHHRSATVPTFYTPPSVGEVVVLPLREYSLFHQLNRETHLPNIINMLDQRSLTDVFSHIWIKPHFQIYKNVEVYQSAFGGAEWTITDFRAIEAIHSEPQDIQMRHRMAFSHPAMAAIQGDRSPESYLEATLLYHLLCDDIHLSNIMYHPRYFGIDLTPLSPWRMCAPLPLTWEPHLYYTATGDPVLVLHVHLIEIDCDPQETVQRLMHVFQPLGYGVRVFREVVAYTNIVFGV